MRPPKKRRKNEKKWKGSSKTKVSWSAPPSISVIEMATSSLVDVRPSSSMKMLAGPSGDQRTLVNHRSPFSEAG